MHTHLCTVITGTYIIHSNSRVIYACFLQLHTYVYIVPSLPPTHDSPLPDEPKSVCHGVLGKFPWQFIFYLHFILGFSVCVHCGFETCVANICITVYAWLLYTEGEFEHSLQEEMQQHLSTHECRCLLKTSGASVYDDLSLFVK